MLEARACKPFLQLSSIQDLVYARRFNNSHQNRVRKMIIQISVEVTFTDIGGTDLATQTMVPSPILTLVSGACAGFWHVLAK
jgi:hypothetical protein